MSQLKLLKVLVTTPNVYATPDQRKRAIAILRAKMKRRDKKLEACAQLKMFMENDHNSNTTH